MAGDDEIIRIFGFDGEQVLVAMVDQDPPALSKEMGIGRFQRVVQDHLVDFAVAIAPDEKDGLLQGVKDGA